jgi:antitoxin Phd
MNEPWQIQDAKNKLSEVIARALKQGPQLITKHGEKTVVVISYAEYMKTCVNPKGNSPSFFRHLPWLDLNSFETSPCHARGLNYEVPA